MKKLAIGLGSMLGVFALVGIAWYMMTPSALPAADAQTFASANQLAAQGNYRAAETLYQQLVNAGVNNADVYYNLANTQTALGDAAHAADSYARAYALAPRDAQIAQTAHSRSIPLTQNEIALLALAAVSLLAILLVRARRRLLWSHAG